MVATLCKLRRSTFTMLSFLYQRVGTSKINLYTSQQACRSPYWRYDSVGDSPCGSPPSRTVSIETSPIVYEKAVTSSMHGSMARWQHSQLINLRRGLGCGV